MTPRETVPPATGERGEETHPSWGMISSSRSQGTPRTLFDSDVRHLHTIHVQISTASRQRDLNRDWLHTERGFVEIEMSEAQWASFVSSSGSGTGVPCTIRRREEDLLVPDAPYQPRLGESTKEVGDAAEKAFARVKEAFAAYEEKKNAANFRHLRAAIENAPRNLVFAAESLTEHTENVVQKARADIEAMATSKAAQLGLEPGDTALLPEGEDE